MSPNYRRIKGIIVELLRQNGDHLPLGKHWITRFKQRHPDLKGGYTKAMEMKRLTALSSDVIDPFFTEVQTLQSQYKVLPQNIHNMDEKGFQMGQTSSDYCLFDAKSGPPLAPSTGNTKWVTVIECIAANGSSLPPYIIFIGQEAETQWWPISKTLTRWIWAFSPKGWTDNELGKDWLKRVMIPHV
jgi:hypothetical protein